MREGPLPQSFYRRDAVSVAVEMIGALLRFDGIILRITETEAYGGPHDSASHSRSGVTPRNHPMWGPPGHTYIYLCYGIHHLLNITVYPEGEAGAVLIRACEPVEGIELVRSRRANRTGPALLAGPGRVTQALGVTTAMSGAPVYQGKALSLHPGVLPSKMLRGPRVGIGYAKPKDQRIAWRFADGTSPWVSQPQTLRPWRGWNCRLRYTELQSSTTDQSSERVDKRGPRSSV